jgi:hypothetical protein
VTRAGDGDVTERFLDRSAGDAMLRDVVTSAKLPHLLEARLGGGRILPRPLFAPAAEIERASDDLQACLELLVSLPGKLFDGDLRRYCAALGMDERRAATLTAFATEDPPHYGRADLYHDGAAFRLLEFNVASDLGGIDLAEINSALLDNPRFADFAREHRLSYVDTCERLAECLRDTARTIGSDHPRVALLAVDYEKEAYAPLLRSFVQVLGEHGVETVLGDVRDVRVGTTAPQIHGRRFNVVLRYFNIDHVLERPDVAAAAGALQAAQRRGQVRWWTPLDSSLYSNKGCMALLSDPRWRSAFSSEEAALVDRLVPWTRAPHAAGGGFDDLVRRCEADREQLLLKPATGTSAAGIVAGWETAPAVWRQALEGSRDSDAVVQRRVRARSETVVDPRSGSARQWIAAYGLYATPRGYGGGYARVAPLDQGSQVVSFFTNPDTRFAMLYASGERA